MVRFTSNDPIRKKKYSAVQCSAVQCSAVQCSAVQHQATQRNTTQRNATQRNAKRLNAQFRVVPDQIRIRFLQTYCTAWYGCQTWLLNTTLVKGINIECVKDAQSRSAVHVQFIQRETKPCPSQQLYLVITVRKRDR